MCDQQCLPAVWHRVTVRLEMETDDFVYLLFTCCTAQSGAAAMLEMVTDDFVYLLYGTGWCNSEVRKGDRWWPASVLSVRNVPVLVMLN